nr:MULTISPECIES: hypothetical protein [Bacillales]
MFKKLINSLLGSRPASRTYRRYSRSDYKHGGYHKQHDGRGHGHGHAYYRTLIKETHFRCGLYSSWHHLISRSFFMTASLHT